MPVPMWGCYQAALGGVKENFIYFVELEGILHIIEFNDSQVWLWVEITEGTFKIYRFLGCI